MHDLSHVRRQLPDLRTAFLGGLRLGRGARRRRSWRSSCRGARSVPWRSWRRPWLAGAAAVRPWRCVAALVVFAAVATAARVRHERVHRQSAHPARRDRGPRRPLDRHVVDDPRTIQGRFGEEVLVRLEVRQVECGRSPVRLREPVLVFGRESWLGVPLGATVRVERPPRRRLRGDVAAVLSTAASPDIRAGPDPWWRASGRVRAALRESVAELPPDRRALVPALVDGDDAGLDPALADDFRTTGLTHLLAVSGTNLTLVVGFALVVARWCRVRGRWLYVVGAARDPRVRAARPRRAECAPGGGDGVGGLLGMGANGADRGTRALGVATIVLLLARPGLASAVGFGLSVLATAGILLLAPGWRDALARWLPRWLAEAVAVPAAAQLACTPLIAAIAGQVSLVAVAANLLAAPAVGPATVLGLVGGLVTLVWPAAGRLVGAPRLVRGVDRRGGRSAAPRCRPRRWRGGAARLALALLTAALRGGRRCWRRVCCAAGRPGWPAAVLLVSRSGPAADSRAGRPTGG